MSSSFPGAASDTTADRDALLGFEIKDPGVGDSVREGITRVEELLHSSVHSDLEFATETSLHLVDAGGKRFRPLFALLCAQFGEPDRESVVKSAVIVELVHLATLYHDDVMDEATIRRGASSANARWNNSVAILTGDFLFAQASRLVADLGTDAAREMAQTFGALVTGQMRETVGARSDEDAVAHYLRVIEDKTASLIAIAGRFGATFAGADEHHVRRLEQIGRLIGIAFQISDDIIDIASPADESGKSPGTDLREGVQTLPMLYSLADPESDPRLRDLLAGPVTTDGEVEEALRRLRVSEGLTRSRRTLDEYTEQARSQLMELADCPAREALGTLVDHVVARVR